MHPSPTCREPADLAILIIPAQFVPDELERCGSAGIKAAVILQFRLCRRAGRSRPPHAGRDRAPPRARYDMAVSGPNTEGFANIEAALCPTFSPAMDKTPAPSARRARSARAKSR